MVALATFATIATVGFSWGLANFITHTFAGDSIDETASYLQMMLTAGLVRAVIVWLQELVSARAALATKNQLRTKYLAAISQKSSEYLASQGSAKITSIATSGLDSLDNYFAKYLPQLFYTAIVTPVLVWAIISSDAASGLTLLITLPLIPVFMILIGLLTRNTQNQQLAALHRLSQHLLEVLRGLTTLRIFNREQNQIKVIATMAQELRKRTMKVLRISFLSGFALELISSLSVALIAVSIGLRMVNGELSFETGLFVLLLAPEAFLPIRMVGANFHAAADGIAASTEILDTISSQTVRASLAKPRPKAGKVTLLSGPSGAGKSTYIGELLEGIGYEKCAWLPQQLGLLAATVRNNIVGPSAQVDDAALESACKLAALDDVDLDAVLAESNQGVSGGQAQRIAFARAIYRAKTLSSVTHILLDEPISALDARRSKIVQESIQTLAQQGFAIAVASHQALKCDEQVEVNFG